MLWGKFRCDNPDFAVRAVPDGDIFRVRRECLIRGSTVFRDMFSCCDSACVTDTPDPLGQAMELYESAAQLNVLFHVLHHLPEPYVLPKVRPEDKDYVHIQSVQPEHAIPFPVLSVILTLADKYAFSDEITDVLHSHLAAYASTYPLRVYGYAVEHGLQKMAGKTSQYLLHPPLASYSIDEIKAIPTAEAYHRLVVLHEFRIKKLKELLVESDIFPHGYGECPRHAQRTRYLWEARRDAIISNIQADTDVAAEMLVGCEGLKGCQTCEKACNAAVAMLSYQCGKIPKRTDKIPK